MSYQKFSENSLYLTAENDMRNICSRLLNPLGINYFYYLCVYNDMSCYFLSTHNNLVQYAFEQSISVGAPIAERLIKKNFIYFILPIGAYNKWLHHAYSVHNLEHFIDLVDRHDDYIELFCFGSTSNNAEIVNFYLTNMDFLEKFKLYFKDKASKLLNDSAKNKIILPEVMLPPYMGLKYNSESKKTASVSTHFEDVNLFITGKYSGIKLSSRQYDCLSQLAGGCTAKESARNLGISHRTFENYLAHLKLKFDCHKKSELINIFLKNFK